MSRKTAGDLKVVRKAAGLAAGLVVFLLLICPFAAGSGPGVDIGVMSIISTDLKNDSPGELVLQYTAGKDGVPQGQEVWVELPRGWDNRTSCPKVNFTLAWQSQDKSKDGFFQARSLPAGVVIRPRIGKSVDIYGVSSRYGHVFSFQVTGRELKPGETMELVFRHHLQGSKSYPPLTAGSGHVFWTVVPAAEEQIWQKPTQRKRTLGNGGKFLVSSTWLTVAAGDPVHVLVTLPSKTQAGENVRLRIRLLDDNYNLVKTWPAPAKLEKDDGITGLPAKLEPGPDGVAEVMVTARNPGVFRVKAEVPGTGKALSNPMEVSAQGPEPRIFWGDIHSHSYYSMDGMGEKPFDYARNASALDFYANTEHNYSVTAEEWDEILKQESDFNKPPNFVTLVAFENSSASPSGHFNLYFSQDRANLLFLKNVGLVQSVYGEVAPLVIHHHTGIIWGVRKKKPVIPEEDEGGKMPGPLVQWDQLTSVKMDAVEIYSIHGQSELYDPSDSLSYEKCSGLLESRITSSTNCPSSTSGQGPYYARDGWAQGFIMGTVAGSDDHHAQPGKAGAGLTAVYAPSLSRQNVFDAIRNRQTYATTGDRIILGFSINGKAMGSVIEAASELNLQIHAVGTAPIKKIELMKFDQLSKQWSTALSEKPGSDTADLTRKLASSGPAIYYVRLEEDGETNGRAIRAWSSPIWVK